MNPRRSFRLGLFAGGLIALSLNGLHADWLGKEKYAEYVLNHWTSAKWSVPIEIVGLVLALVVMFVVSWTTSPRRGAPRQSAPVIQSGWGWGCKGQKGQNLVVLRFQNKALKKGIEFELDAPVARRVAQSIVDEAEFSERAMTDPEERRTSWEMIDAVDLDDGTHPARGRIKRY